jgi:hypothetical protein
MAGTVIGIFMLIEVAKSAAGDAKHGFSVHGESIFGVPFLGLRADRVSMGTARRINAAGVNTRQGEASGIVWFYAYDPKLKTGRTLRLPANNVVVAMPRQGEPCGL